MRLGWLGGSFDPPHFGHLTIARTAATDLRLDRVLFAPAGLQPLKRSGSAASFADRLEMVRLLCSTEPSLCEPSALDSPHPEGTPNYTIDALERLRLEEPGAEIFALVGADNLLELPHWHRADRLLQVATWVALSRPGYALPHPLPQPLETARTEGRLRIIPDVVVPISSSLLRDRLRQGQNCDALTSAAVLHFIRQHSLYGSPTAPVA